VAGPDEYLFGEEKALLEVIEGKPPMPRLLPPHEHGLFATAPQTGWESAGLEPGHTGIHESNPTLANNVETLSNVPHIMARGARWFRSMGTEASPGNHVCTVVGDVAAPGVAEIELGAPLSSVLAWVGGGPRPGQRIKAVFSGVANPVITAEQLDVPVSYEGFKAAGSAMGACGFIVYDDSACMVDVAREFSRFLYIESCGQCPPCKLGSGEITSHLERIEQGRGDTSDLRQIDAWLAKVTDGNRCFLAVEEQQMVASILLAFPDEFADHLDGRGCWRTRSITVPKLVDLRDGVATYDERHRYKGPDWTYEPHTTRSGDA
jgi:NADH:ubiquinone oxidoreductase subunit F (NADH-binding)